MALRIRAEEVLVGLNNPNDLNIRAIQNPASRSERATVQKTFDMTMNQTNDAYFHRRTWNGGRYSGVRVNSKESKHQHKNQFHNVALQLSRKTQCKRAATKSDCSASFYETCLSSIMHV